MIWRDQRGVTLVEMFVILAIISLLALASYTLMGNVLQVMTSKGAAEQVAGAIREARQAAITRGALYCIKFSASPVNTYFIGTAADSATCDQVTVLATEVIGNEATVTVPSPAPTMIFDPIGNVVLPAAPVTLVVDTSPASCAGTITVTLYGGVRSQKC